MAAASVLPPGRTWRPSSRISPSWPCGTNGASIPLTRPDWVPVVSVPIATTSAMATAEVNFQPFHPTQGTLTITNPVNVRPKAGSRFNDRAISRVGFQEVTISLTRDALDSQILRWLEDPGTEFGIRVAFRTAERITGQWYHEIFASAD